MRRLSGRFRSALVIGVQGIRARKLRTLLSMISLFLGVLAVVTVQAGAETAQRALLSNVELTAGIDGTRVMYVPPFGDASKVTLDAVRGQANAVALTGLNAIIGEPGVVPVNPGGAPFNVVGGYGGGPGNIQIICDPTGQCEKLEVEGPVQVSGQAIEVYLTAMTGDVRQFRPFRPQTGRWLDFTDRPSLSPRLVLNKEAAKGFAMYQVPAEMRIGGAAKNPTPQIIGVVDDGFSEPRAYVRQDEVDNWLTGDSTAAQNYRGGPGLSVLLSPAAAELEQIIKLRLEGLGIPSDRMYVETINSREQAESTLALLRWVFLGLASLVLLIGVAGILNVGLATVGERVEEFALRRAVGTPRLLLAGIVLAETLLTGLLTAAAAIGVGAATFQLVGPLLATRQPILEDLAFPWQAGVAGVIAGLLGGLLGGLVPAIRAARIPIATVMRA